MVMLNGMGGSCWHLFSSYLTLNCHLLSENTCLRYSNLSGMFGYHFTSQVLPFHFQQRYIVHNHLSGSLLDLSHCVPVVLVLGSPKLESPFQVVSHKCWIERNSHFPWCADCFDSDTQIGVGLLGMDASPVHIPVPGLSTRIPTSFYAKLFSSHSVPQPVLVHGVTPAQSARFCILPLLTLTKFSLLFQPAQVPSQFCRGSYVQSSRLFKQHQLLSWALGIILGSEYWSSTIINGHLGHNRLQNTAFQQC